MSVLEQKKRILDSLYGMDKDQAGKVLEYIRSLLMSPSEQKDYKRFKESAMKQINEALQEG